MTSLPLDALLHALNPVLRGWTGYYRHAATAAPPLPAMGHADTPGHRPA
jgi:hypothetical protein